MCTKRVRYNGFSWAARRRDLEVNLKFPGSLQGSGFQRTDGVGVRLIIQEQVNALFYTERTYVCMCVRMYVRKREAGGEANVPTNGRGLTVRVEAQSERLTKSYIIMGSE